MEKTNYMRLKGSQKLRPRLLLSTLSSKPILIDDIRSEDTWPGLRSHEISLLRLFQKVTDDDCLVEITVTGAKLKYRPRVVVGGRNLVHDCGVSRSIGYFLEPLLLLAFFGKKPLSIRQITDAVVVAKNLGATLVLPDIRGSRLGDKRNFGEVYDVDKFVGSLEGVVRVVKETPSGISVKNLAVAKVSNRVTENNIAVHVEPVYRSKGNIRLATYFPSVNMKKKDEKSESDSVSCLAMFGSLELQPEVREVVDLMVERLRTLNRGSDGRFVAVDLRVDMLQKKGCKEKGEDGHKSCYNAKEVAKFLSKLGFDKDTTIYLTQSRWDKSLEPHKEFFPKTYTKEAIIPVEKKEKFLNTETPTLEEVIDFYIASESDVFVPAISGLFYANVAGKRIASGRTEILIPAKDIWLICFCKRLHLPLCYREEPLGLLLLLLVFFAAKTNFSIGFGMNNLTSEKRCLLVMPFKEMCLHVCLVVFKDTDSGSSF